MLDNDWNFAIVMLSFYIVFAILWMVVLWQLRCNSWERVRNFYPSVSAFYSFQSPSRRLLYIPSICLLTLVLLFSNLGVFLLRGEQRGYHEALDITALVLMLCITVALPTLLYPLKLREQKCCLHCPCYPVEGKCSLRCHQAGGTVLLLINPLCYFSLYLAVQLLNHNFKTGSIIAMVLPFGIIFLFGLHALFADWAQKAYAREQIRYAAHNDAELAAWGVDEDEFKYLGSSVKKPGVFKNSSDSGMLKWAGPAMILEWMGLAAVGTYSLLIGIKQIGLGGFDV